MRRSRRNRGMRGREKVLVYGTNEKRKIAVISGYYNTNLKDTPAT